MDESNLQPSPPLQYEETPVIEPLPTSDVKEVSTPAQPAGRSEVNRGGHSFGAILGMTILFILLFAVGVGVSVFLRQFIASRSASSVPPTAIRPTPMPSTFDVKNVRTPAQPAGGSEVSITPTSVIDPYAGWKTTQVISGTTKAAVPGISFRLPPEMLSPICDGTSCASQGTYLPDGSRFTVAARGKGQLLVDARGNIVVTDSSGKSFTTKQVMLTGGRKALEYSGLFSGTTVGGYIFSQMRGLMIEIDEDETLEMNHFTPSGVTTEFTKDDELFDKIIASLTIARFSQATITPSLFPTKTATASPTP